MKKFGVSGKKLRKLLGSGGLFPCGSFCTKFKPTPDNDDTANKNGMTYRIKTHLHCITAMSVYEHKSMEELRWEDQNYVIRHLESSKGVFVSGQRTPIFTGSMRMLDSGQHRWPSTREPRGGGSKTGRVVACTNRNRLHGGTYSVKFNPSKGKDTANKKGMTYNVDTSLHCITGMTEYADKSMEELRWEDNQLNSAKCLESTGNKQTSYQETTSATRSRTKEMIESGRRHGSCQEGTHESVQREQDGNLRLRHLGIGMNDLQQQVTEMEQQLQRLSERRPTGKEGHAQDGRNTTSNSQVATSHNVASWSKMKSCGYTRVEELEAELLETRVLYATTLDDYKILGLASDDDKNGGLMFRVRCNKTSQLNKERTYTMKAMTNCFQNPARNEKGIRNECNILSQLPFHENIIRMWAFFYDRANLDVLSKFTILDQRHAWTVSLFLLLDEHPTNMMKTMNLLINNEPAHVIHWFTNLVSGLLFLETHHIVHRDLKMENLLLSVDGNLVLSDFRKAILLNSDFELEYENAETDIGGNRAHLSPEVLNATCGPNKTISYVKQPVWAAGVLAYELAGHPNPFTSDAIDQCCYTVDQLPPLHDTYYKNSQFVQSLPKWFTDLVRGMLDFDPALRPKLASCYNKMSFISPVK